MKFPVPCLFLISATAAAAADLAATSQTFFETHCYDCHDDISTKAGLNLLDLEFDSDDPGSLADWALIHDRVSSGEMPPADEPQPQDGERLAFVDEVEEGLIAVELEQRAVTGRAALRRLSREEFANSLKDLLSLPHLDLAAMLPPDGIEGHHRKSARALDISHVTVSRYMEVADHALMEALAPRLRPVENKVIRAELASADGVRDTLQTLYVQLRQGNAIPLIDDQVDTTTTSTRGNFAERIAPIYTDEPPFFNGVATFVNNRFNHNIVVRPFEVKQTGTYRIRVHGWGVYNDNGKILPSDRVETVAFYDKAGNVLGRCDLQPDGPNTGETTAWLKEGEPVEYLAISTPNRVIQGRRDDGLRYEQFQSPGIALQWFELEGPLDEWPLEGHRTLLGDLPVEPTEPQSNGLSWQVTSEQPDLDLQRQIRKFARRAFRRPLRGGDVTVAINTANARLEAGEPFIEALLAGYRTVLSSPDFLLREEKAGQLDDWALATRLSFFLTNSPPDAALRRAAVAGELQDDEVLRVHTERLLNDERSERFVAHFCDHWLNLREINLTEPDENLYPEYSGLVSESMVAETRAYVQEMIRQNLGAQAVVDSDFLMINQRLAELYGIEGVDGSHIRKVEIPEDHLRGGLITQGSILKLTANGTTTSPVVRGTYALEHLLGDPPPPPPATVPAIEPDVTGASTVREQLERHREAPECASCHAMIDPPGFALESFDVMGQWRDHYRVSLDGELPRAEGSANGRPVNYAVGPVVDSAGQLPDGSEFEGMSGFRDALQSYEPKIAHNLMEHLVLYATGAPISFADHQAVDEMLEALKPDGYGMRSMIHEIVQSELFRHK